MEFLGPLMEQLTSMWTGLIKLLPLLGIALILLLLTWLVAKGLVKVLKTSLKKSRMRPSLKDLFATLLSVGIWTLGILIAVTVIFPSLTPAKMLAALGLGSVAIGFAFKDVFENFLAGILIMLREPMRIGDYIECEGVEGNVEVITIRDTYVRKLDNELILVPNAHLFQNPLKVVTDRDLRRHEIIAGVAYGEDVDACRDIIQQAVEGVDLVNKDRPVQVFAREFADSSINYTVRWWAGSKPIDMHQSRDKVIAAIKRALDDAGVEIPFPYRTLTFNEPLRLVNETEDSPHKSDKDEKGAQKKDDKPKKPTKSSASSSASPKKKPAKKS